MRKNKDYRKISELREWDKNPRSIKEKDFERLKKQIQKLGQYKPVLITPDGEVIGGNMRLKAYNALGIEDVWVSVVTPKDENEKLEYALSDNDRAGFYDEDLLANLTADYPEFNWGDYAVDLKEPQTLDDLINSLQPIVEDEVPEVSDGEAESKLGEVYQLGRHRLMCGDSTKIEDVEKLMNGQKADMVFTDPPYGVDYEGGAGNEIKREKLAGDDRGIYYEWLSLWKAYAKSSAMYYVWFADREGYQVYKAVEDCGFNIKALIIWNKLNAHYGAYMAHYKQKHEPLLCFYNKPPKWYGDTVQTTVWEYEQPSKNEHHPTQKPVGLAIKAINNSSKQEDIVLDLFGGSGTTLIACEQTNRTCYMMELDEKYCDVIRKRYENYINNKK